MIEALVYCSTNSNQRYIILFGIWLKVFLSLEIQISSFRTALALDMTTEDNHTFHFQELEVLDEKRLLAQQCIELY